MTVPKPWLGVALAWWVCSCAPARVKESRDISPRTDSDHLALLRVEESEQAFSPDEGAAFSLALSDTSTLAIGDESLQYLWWAQEPYEVPPVLSVPPIVFDLPRSEHPSVDMWIRFLQGRGRKWFEIWLARSTRYVPMFYGVLDAHQLPRDLVFLAMVESGFSPRAFSSAAAAGPWQFMPETGRRYGLRVGFWVDERRDFEKSAEAAARHLRWLHGRFEDWHLAMAAYNAGAGRIRSALRRSRARGYWSLAKTRWIRRETKHYVPKILAAAMVSKEPEKYGFTNISYQPPMAYDIIEVDVATSLETIGEACGGLPKVALEELNPSLRASVTPPGERWSVRVPPGLAKACSDGLEGLPEEIRYTFRYYRTSLGESVGAIAKKFRTHPEAILRFHGVASQEALGDYPEMAVPVRLAEARRFAVTPPVKKARSARYGPGPTRVVRYVIRRGDSLNTVARRFGVSPQQIRQWNQLGEKKFQPGQSLKIHMSRRSEVRPAKKAKPRNHRVKKGESLWVIARRYGVSVERLRRLNGLRRGQGLQIGQVLRTR